MYTQEKLEQVRALTRKRLMVAVVPAALVLAAAIALFVYGQINRNDQLWVVTTILTIVAGCYFLFFYGVYVRPMRMYRKHIDIMLHGRRRETTGKLKSWDDQVCDKNGVDCVRIMINVGDKDDGEDDRLFYFDAHKENPNIPLGSSVTITSNDMMVADLVLN
ncbi:MAG: hypothetical protein PHI98_14080 [Eubacteriales bacterium]|nr:hypothetical protein [Eubacteriales bacterium]